MQSDRAAKVEPGVEPCVKVEFTRTTLNQEIRCVRKRLLKTTSWCIPNASNLRRGAQLDPYRRTIHPKS